MSLTSYRSRTRGSCILPRRGNGARTIAFCNAWTPQMCTRRLFARTTVPALDEVSKARARDAVVSDDNVGFWSPVPYISKAVHTFRRREALC